MNTSASEGPMTPSDRRKLRNQQKKSEKTRNNEEIADVSKKLSFAFEVTNKFNTLNAASAAAVAGGKSKTKKIEQFADGTFFDKTFVVTTQKLAIELVNSRLKSMAQRTAAPRPKDNTRTGTYSKPFYFRQEVVDWLKDPRVKFSAKDLAAQMNNSDFNETTTYDGQQLRDVILMTTDMSLTVTHKGEDVEIPTSGLANKNILNDLLNCYVTQNNLKGVKVTKTVKKKDVEETVEVVNNSYWRPDDVMLKYFGKCIDAIVEKERAKEDRTNDGVEISRSCIKNGSMSILAAMADTERNAKYAQVLNSAEDIRDIVQVDASLTRAVYERYKK